MAVRLSRRRRTLVLLAAGSLALLVLPFSASGRLRLAAAAVFEPVTGSVRDLALGVRRRIRAFGRGSRLQRQLEEERRRSRELEARLAEALDRLDRLSRAGRQVQELRALLERVRWRGTPVQANVIRRPGRWESRELIIDCGHGDEVLPGAPVLAAQTVLGVVAEVGAHTSRVLVLGNPDLAVPVLVLETRQQGMLAVSGGRLQVRYVTRDQPVRPGYTVLTSGLDGVFPTGCLVGRVAPGVTAAADEPFYIIFVERPPEAARPETVSVLTGAAGAPAGLLGVPAPPPPPYRGGR